MSVIKLHTANERLMFDSKPAITSGNIDIDSISVTLCGNWREVGEKADIWAVFYRDENEKLKRKLVDGSCMIPSEMLLERGLFYFGIYAENTDGDEIKTSKIAEYEVKQGIATKAEAESNLIKAATTEIKAELERIKATHTDTSVITDFTSFFAHGLRSEIIGKVDTSNALKITSMFNGYNTLEEVPPMNTSKCKTFDTVFYNCSKLKTAPELDTSNGESFNAMFNGCGALEAPPNYDTGKAEILSSMFSGCSTMRGSVTLDTKSCTTLSSTFQNCTVLGEIIFTDTSKVIQWVGTFNQCKWLHTIKNLSLPYGGYSSTTFFNCLDLQNVTFGVVKIKDSNFTLTSSSKLTAESIVSLFNALVDNTGGTVYTIRLGSTNLAKLTTKQKTIAYDKNYQLA